MNAMASSTQTAGPQLDNRRVLAGLVDLVLVAAGAAVILFAAGAVGGGSTEVTPALIALVTAWALYYYFALESGGGQTLGKRLMKLRVVRADGSAASTSEIAVRTILRVIDGIFVPIIGLITMLATGKRRQRLGDLAAGTIIVDAGAAPQAAPATAAVARTVAVPEVAEEAPEVTEAVAAPEVTEAVAEAPVVEAPVVEAPAVSEDVADDDYEYLDDEDEDLFDDEDDYDDEPETEEEPVVELSAPAPPAAPELKPFEPFSEPAAEAPAEHAAESWTFPVGD